jgi:hypothetical protein
MVNTLLSKWQNDSWPEIKCCKPLADREGVIDSGVFHTIEIDKVFDAINHASTTVGQATLYRSLTAPLDTTKAVKEKQDAVKALQQDQQLKERLENIIQRAAESENDLYTLLFGEFIGAFAQSRAKNEIEGYGYRQYRFAVRFILQLVNDIQSLDAPKSSYLTNIINKVKAFT